MPTYICSRCKRELALDNLHFNRDRTTKTGFKHKCLECYGREFRKEGFKKCTNCRAEYPKTKEYFYQDVRAKSGLHSWCKVCINKKNREYVLTHAEQVKGIWDRHYEANKEKVKQRARLFYENNRERIDKWKMFRYHNDPNYRRIRQESCKRYRIRNPHKQAERKHVRRLREKTTLMTLTSEQWFKCVSAFNKRCAYCGVTGKLTQEHFVPVMEGGEYTVKNIIPACGRCNSSKGHRNFFSWYPKQPYYSKQREQKILSYLGYKNGLQQTALF